MTQISQHKKSYRLTQTQRHCTQRLEATVSHSSYYSKAAVGTAVSGVSLACQRCHGGDKPRRARQICLTVVEHTLSSLFAPVKLRGPLNTHENPVPS